MKIIADLRIKKGWSQQELANRAHVKQPYISRWETGERTPSLKNAQKLADAFGVTLNYLVGKRRRKANDQATTVGENNCSNSL